MIKAKLVTATMPDEFDKNVNAELAELKNVKTVQFSTAVSNHPDENNSDWDTVYSALILYEN